MLEGQGCAAGPLPYQRNHQGEVAGCASGSKGCYKRPGGLIDAWFQAHLQQHGSKGAMHGW